MTQHTLRIIPKRNETSVGGAPDTPTLFKCLHDEFTEKTDLFYESSIPLVVILLLEKFYFFYPLLEEKFFTFNEIEIFIVS